MLILLLFALLFEKKMEKQKKNVKIFICMVSSHVLYATNGR